MGKILHYQSASLFSESGKKLSDYLSNLIRQTEKYIESEKEDYLLNVNVDEYEQYLVSRTRVEPFDFKFDDLVLEIVKRDIPSEAFPITFNVFRGRKYTKDVLQFHIPYTGDKQLFGFVPNRMLLWGLPIKYSDEDFYFEIINFNNNTEEVTREKANNLQNIKTQLENVNNEIEKHNSEVESIVHKLVHEAKIKIIQRKDFIESLGIPIKKDNNASATFSVPPPKMRKQIIVSRPEAIQQGYKPTPTLDEETYKEILSLIHDVGRQYERMPSTYAGKDEETLRDHFLLFLEPNFRGSATGETFNKSGKTDILLRYEGANIFIAECKFWRGGQAFLDGITQLLGYITWRDSKAAIMIFVQNKEFSVVLKNVKEKIIQHPNHIKLVSIIDETWLDYRFALNGDREREISLSVMLFHFP